MWQDDIISVAPRFIEACLERVYTSAGPPMGTRHLISPELAGNVIVTLQLLLLEPVCAVCRSGDLMSSRSSRRRQLKRS